MAKILVVDDDPVLCEMFVERLRRYGHDAKYVSTLTAARESAFSEDFELIFLDVQMPDGNGLVELPKLKKAPSRPEIIIITGQGSPDGAELAIKSGAWDYLEKSTAIKEMVLPLSRALQYRTAKRATDQQVKPLNRQAIIGSSSLLNKCLEQVAKISSSDASVLITGETGSGKELFAKVIHENSNRSHESFVVVDCAALPATLVESTLFGHKKGAFTGADTSRSGLIVQADGGTLFLDEVGEMDLNIQKIFLRTLQEHTFRPVGGETEVSSDFRLLVATNRDLDSMVEAGTFRSDLLFRLKAMTIDVPPLRERLEDISEIAIFYVNHLCRKYGMKAKGFAPDLFETISSYAWPGNVRELMNCMDVTLNNGQNEPILYSKHLPDTLRIALARATVTKKIESQSTVTSLGAAPLPSFKQYREQTIAMAEKEYLQRLIRLTKGNIKQSCEQSGLGRTRLYTLMKKHNISRFGWDST